MIDPRTIAGSPARTLVAIVLSTLIAACATSATSIEQQWVAPPNQQTQLARVVALYIGGNEVTTRRAAEDRLAQRLASQGVLAAPAYRVIADADAKDLDTAKVKLRAAGFDGVVAMRVVDARTEVDYVPNMVNGYWGSDWYYGWDYNYGSTYIPYVREVVRVETTAYDLQDNQVVWSAVSRTVDPDNTADLVNEVTAVVANELGKRGVVVASRRVTPPNEG